ncbi:MAG: tyrosine-protein phosphatase [Paludibacteraceae bacterium]|nr:tyrosine-protein phosphatase [Paludibacteraceae bacterium]
MKRIIKLAIICASIVGLAIVSVHAFQSNNSDKSSMTTRPSNWAEPITLAGVPNLHKVTDHLYRSAQPTAEGMSNLAELGIKTVINLRDNHSDKDEIGELPLNARRIEIFAGNMKDEYVEEFLSIVNDTSAVPVLVHCLHGADRTGTMCAMYRILCQGWSPNDAINEMENGGYGYHSIWSNIPRFIRESTKRFVARKKLVE